MSNILQNIFANFYKLGLFATLFFVATITFYAKESIDVSSQNIFHFSFITIGLIIFFVLLFFNKLKPLFFAISIYVCYFTLNYLRNNLQLEGPLYHNIGFFMLFSELLSVFAPQKKITTKKSLPYVFIFLISLCIIEYLSKQSIFIPYNYVFLSIIIGIFLFLYSSIKNQIIYYGYFFAYLSSVFGYYYAFSNTGFSMFFGISMIILLLSTTFYVYISLYYTKNAGIKNKHSFIKYSKEKIIKCSLAVVCIDATETIKSQFGQKGLDTIITLVAEIIKEKHFKVFYLQKDEFVISFEGQGIDDAYEDIENLKRKIATTDFILSGYKKPIKITITSAVVERKRMDGNMLAVFQKAQKILLKKKDFNNNFTFKG